MAGIPFVIATNGFGISVTEAANGLPYEIAPNGFGTPVVFVPSGGAPVTGAETAIQLGAFQSYAKAPFSAYTGMFGIYLSPPLTDYDAGMDIYASQFPLRTKFDWRVGAGQPARINGFLHTDYGNYDDSPSAGLSGVTPRQLYTITQLDVDFTWTIAGDASTGILMEFWAGSTAASSGPFTKLFEVAVHPLVSAPSQGYLSGLPNVGSGSYVDKFGQTWVVKRDGTFYSTYRPSFAAYEGMFDWASYLAFLISAGMMTGNEWFNGLGWGPEPYNGAGSMIVDGFSVQYAGAARVPWTISNLVAVPLSGTTIRLDYQVAAGATSHQYRRDGGSWTSMPGDRIVTGLTPSTSYNFEVRGVNGTGNGAASNVAPGTTTDGAVNKVTEPWTTQNGWSSSANFTYSSSRLNSGPAQTAYNSVSKSYPGIFTSGKSYRIRVTKSLSAGNFRIGLSNASQSVIAWGAQSSAAAYDVTVICPTAGELVIIQTLDVPAVGWLDDLLIDELP